MQTVTITLSSKSISAFSQNEGADSKPLLSIVSLPVPPSPASPWDTVVLPQPSLMSPAPPQACALRRGRPNQCYRGELLVRFQESSDQHWSLRLWEEQGAGDTIPGFPCCHQERSHSCPGRACGCSGGLGFTSVYKEVTKKINSEMVPVCFHIEEDKDMNMLHLRATILP